MEGVANKLIEDAMTKTVRGKEKALGREKTYSCSYGCDKRQHLDISRRYQNFKTSWLPKKKKHVAVVVLHPLPEMPQEF
ncbi:hypothetical protein ACOSQ3_014828 [Xanthoceras sorbifolium]